MPLMSRWAQYVYNKHPNRVFSIDTSCQNVGVKLASGLCFITSVKTKHCLNNYGQLFKASLISSMVQIFSLLPIDVET